MKDNMESEDDNAMPLDLLIVSSACFTSINRNIYKLFAQKGYSVAIIVPRMLEFGSVKKSADPPSKDDPLIIYLNLRGSNPRIYQYQDLIETFETKRPKRILLDTEPVSLIALKIGRWCQANHTTFYCFTYENFSLGIVDTYKRLGYKGLPMAFIKRTLLFISRKVVKGLFTINDEGTAIYKSESFKNIVKVPLGFDPAIFHIDDEVRAKVRKTHSINSTAIAFFGRVCHEKGVHILVAALSKLMQYDWVLIIDEFSVYKNEYNHTLQGLLEETGILDRVIFINPSHLEIAGYMNAVDLVVIPSISTPKWIEQYGRVAPESMACGKIVIASDSGALPMLLNGHGIVFEEGNVQALSKILEEFLNTGPGSNENFVKKDISQYAHKNLSIYTQYQIMADQFDSD